MYFKKDSSCFDLHFLNGESESHSIVSDSATPSTVQSMELSRQEYGHGLPFSSLRDLPNPGIETGSPELQADSLSTEL